MTNTDIAALVKRLRGRLHDPLTYNALVDDAADALEACQANYDEAVAELTIANDRADRSADRAEKAEAALGVSTLAELNTAS